MHGIVKLVIAIAFFAVGNGILFPTVDTEIGTVAKEARDHRKIYTEILAQKRPKVVLLGNSMLGEAVNEAQFEEQLECSAFKFWFGGTTSAWWYLSLKNFIAQAPTPPNYVFVFFRDEFLTEPTFRVTGANKAALVSFFNGPEPEVERLTSLKNINKIDYWLERNLPAFRNRQIVQQALSTAVKEEVISRLHGVEANFVQQSINSVFAEERLSSKLMTAKQSTAEANTESVDRYNFDDRVNKSFLPLLINVAKANGIQIAFVRVKRRAYAQSGQESPELKDYIAHLDRFLVEHGSKLFDFQYEDQIEFQHFANGDHLNRGEGQRLFTKLFANAAHKYITNNEDTALRNRIAEKVRDKKVTQVNTSPSNN